MLSAFVLFAQGASTPFLLPSSLVGLATSVVSGLYLVFWLWMIWHCVRTEPDRFFWLWMMVVVQVVGPLLYFGLRYLPSLNTTSPAFVRRWTRGRELTRLETAAIQIGNAHQYCQWADALRDVGRLDAAARAYGQSLARDPFHLPALWGATQVAVAQRRPLEALDLARRILEKDPQYKFGDVSLALGKAILDAGDPVGALAHFEQHVKRWRHPEAVYVLAKLYSQQGNARAARQQLEALLLDLNGAPVAIARKQGRWKSRARQLLRQLPVA